jgi:hypothetical protein
MAIRVGGSLKGQTRKIGWRSGFRLVVRQRALERALARRRLHHFGLQIEIETLHPVEPK